ncbi:alpha/beta hydrolase [Cochlodiniinecator piscidefendens]|uniref:alpha/beta hydrolase n=1 Tax=Cochlodiniinecator piscidefendens TaxID=2715756 RepID=UPI00140868B7|nr:alpha/beta hydrolase [Cochlodiniinecator piscidefendens]
MERRSFLRFAGVSAIAAASGQAAQAQQDSGNEVTAFVLVHGSWHGGWSWELVAKHLNDAGHMTVSIDLPGNGLDAGIPRSFEQRPLDPVAFATEVSKFASIEADEYADAVVEGANRAIAMGATKVIAVGHSSGGVPITFAAAKEPEKFQGLHYVAAVAPVGEKPSGAYFALPAQQEKAKLWPLILADPATVGAFRVDPRSTDPEYLATFKAALAADVDDDLLSSVRNLLTPDSPASKHNHVPEFAEGFSNIKKTYVRCTEDFAVVPEVGAAIVDDMNATWPNSPTNMVDIVSSHEVMFSKPKELAEILIANA